MNRQLHSSSVIELFTSDARFGTTWSCEMRLSC